MSKRWLAGATPIAVPLAVLLAVALGVALVAHLWRQDSPGSRPDEAPPSFVGARACAPCHEAQYALWQRSQHARAMQEATGTTVLGDFADRRFTYAGTTSTFSRRDGHFVVTTDGPDGRLADYEVKYTFGVAPLQQYLVEVPDGRLQALPFAWDTRPATEGGQRWFHLYPDQGLNHRDPLHWTRPDQNWNWMCAECHSTGLVRGYDLARNAYDTTWKEINVACEACHGPGSRHVAWAEGSRDGRPAGAGERGDPRLTVRLDERRGASWQVDPVSRRPVRSRPRSSRREIDTCGICHSRRAPLGDGPLRPGGQLLDTHDPSLLSDGLYFADGQQLDEVYTYGSFLQSRMYAHGVTCSDCHEPHGGTLRFPGNAVCTQCHVADTYDVAGHTMHPQGSPGARCVECHMPARTYMVVDDRHDHSLRIPRPDLSERFGVPHACERCHRDRGARWATDAIRRTFGAARPAAGFVEALHAARTGAPGSRDALAALAADEQASVIARATALAGLRHAATPAARAAIHSALGAADPLLRAAAAEALLSLDPAARVELAMPLLDDPVKAVRLKAARALAPVKVDAIDSATRERVVAAFAEFVSAQQSLGERPEAHMNLAAFHAARGDEASADAEYRTALRLQPWFVPAYLNLADRHRARGREMEAEAILLEGLRRVPGDGDLSHALGLLRVRQGRRAEALDLLRRSAGARPGNVRYAYVYAVALREAGRLADALSTLETALTRSPHDPDLLYAAALYAGEAGRRADARTFAQRFGAAAPGDPRLRGLERARGAR